MTRNLSPYKVKRRRSSTMTEKLDDLIRLVHRLAGSSRGMTLDEIERYLGVNRRTAECYCHVLGQNFCLDRLGDKGSERFLIYGLEHFFQAPTVGELTALQKVIRELVRKGDKERSELFIGLAYKMDVALCQIKSSPLKQNIHDLMMVESRVMKYRLRPRAWEESLSGKARSTLGKSACRKEA